MWSGNPPGADPAILSGSVLDPDDVEGIIFGNPITTPGTAPLVLGGDISAAEVRRILAGDPVEDGTYIIGGMVYTPVTP